MSTAANAGQKAKGGWAKKLGIAGGVLVALIVVAYFVGTSAWCFKSFILPKVGQAMNATVTADDAAISPFSGVKLAGLKVQTSGTEPVFAVREVSVRYPSLFDLIGGKINVDEITVTGVQLNIVKNADGSSNLDPLLKSQPGAGQPSTAAAGPAPQVYLKKLTLADSTVRYTETDAKGGKRSAEIGGINVTIEEVGNGKTASVNLKSDLAFSQTATGATDTLKAAVKGDLKLGLDAQMAPAGMVGGVELAVSQATGVFKESAGLAANLQSDWTPTNIKGLALKFSQGGKGLATLAVSGPFDAAKQEGKLKVEVAGVDRNLLNIALNLAGMAQRIDFNQTAINASGEIDLAQGGKKITTSGAVKAARLSVTQDKQTSPEMDLEVGYHVAVDLPGGLAMIQTMSLTGVQNGAEVIRGRLSKPMPINWGKSGGAVDESAFELAVNNLNLADWRAFAAGTDPAGKLNLKLSLLSLQAGQKLVVDLNGSVADFGAKFGSNKVEKADVTLALKSTTEGLAPTEINTLDLRLAQQRQPVLNLIGSGTINSTNLDVNLQTTVEVFLAKAGEFAGLPELQLSQGSLIFKGGITQKNMNPAQTNNPPFERAVTGSVRLADLTGKYATYTLDRLGIAADCDVQIKNDLATIRKLAAAFGQSGAPAGRAEVTGQYDIAKTNGQFVVKLSDVNENLLKSFAAALAPNKLERVSVSANLETRYDAKGDSAAKGSLLVANLLISDPAGQLPKTPLTADLKLDAGMKNTLAEIRALNGAVKLGELNGGSFEVKGSFDTAKTNGQFSVKVVDLNQNALRPFLPAAKDEPTLDTVTINAAMNAKVDMAAETSVTGLVQVANLLFKDPKNQMPKEPLAAQLNLDGSLKQQVLDLRALALQLTPTQRGANLVNVSGKLNLANTNAYSGNLSIKADSLDLTYYYNLFANRPAEAATTTTPTVTSNMEPDAVTLPLTNFTCDVNVGRLYLLDVAASNIVANLRINGGRVEMSPFQAVVNGAAASGRLVANLGVPGYTYDTAFNLTRLPLNPMASSFMPYAKDGLRGDLTLAMAVKGAGVTGKSLRENLNGNLTFDVTNAAMVVKNLIKPDTTKKSAGAAAFINTLTGILDPLLNAVGTAVGMPGLVAEPFNVSRMDMQFGGGNIALRDFTLANSKIIVGSRGTIPIADDLMASLLNMPVEISLSRELASRFKVADAPTNATHVKLPDFVLVKGTLAKSETKLNTKALAGAVLSEIGKRVGGDDGGLLQGVGNLLGGGTKSVTNAPPPSANTNQPPSKPATNPPVNDLLNNLFKPKK